jgi:signal transduction histidine kinase
MRIGFRQPLRVAALVEEQVRILVQTGFVLEANDAAARTRGLSKAADLVGRAVSEFTVWSDERNLEVLRNFVASGYRANDVLLRGRNVHGEELYSLNNAAAVIEDGLVSYIWVAQRDVTRGVRGEQALHDLARRLLQVQDKERRRIGRELHDSTGQTLAALEITLGRVNNRAGLLPAPMRANLAECATLASQCTAQIRTASYLLHPPLLDELGLESALRWLVDGFTQRSGIEVTLNLPESLPRLGDDYELTLFRVTQEALANVHRHSGSPTARVRLQCEADYLELEVADQGHGMPPEKLGDLETGHNALGVGVPGMRERLRQLGGELKIVSGPAGTRVKVTLPRPEKESIAAEARGLEHSL